MSNALQIFIKCRFLVVFIGYYLYRQLSADEDRAFDFLLCRHCGHEVTTSEDIFSQPSSNAIRMRNDTILGQTGVLIQMFMNPQGTEFEIITARAADVYRHDQAFSTHSWFKGYLWRNIFCPRCGFHLGWFFEREGSGNSSFFGLILQSLLHQDFADALLITPKSYYS
jgi:hypothetical protein